MKELTKLIKDEMKPALGVTEPGAIAFAVSTARSYAKGDIEQVTVELNSGIYKNAFTCGIPNSNEVGNVFAAALGVVGGKYEKGLEALADITAEDNEVAKKLIEEGKVQIKLDGITSDISIKARVKTESDDVSVVIKDTHTNIVKITHNNETVFVKEETCSNEKQEASTIHRYTLEQFVDYVETVPLEEIEFINKAYEVNMDLFNTGIKSDRTSFAQQLLIMNGGVIFSDDSLKTAQLLCNATIEARVIGLDKPAMSITGSGAHGIIATMPLYAECKAKQLSEEKLLRATALSYLVTIFIKEYSGHLSAFCGCAVASGTAMACALVYLRDGSVDEMSRTINNMASSITGMICDGGNQGCTMKGIVAVDAAFRSVELAMNKAYILNEHGINGWTPEQTMRQMGLIASPGMVGTEKTIVDIFEEKAR